MKTRRSTALVAVLGATQALTSIAQPPGNPAGDATIYPLDQPPFLYEVPLVYPGGDPNDYIGSGVAIDGTVAMIGAPGDRSTKTLRDGAVRVFDSEAGWWQRGQKLRATDGSDGASFGSAIALDGDTAVIGAYAKDEAGPFSGAAYVFERQDGTWAQTQKLTAGNPRPYAWFGRTVAIQGDTILVGAPREEVDDLVSAGAAYVFTRESGGWSLRQRLVATAPTAWAQFGSSLALDSRDALIGAPAYPSRIGSQPGAVHVLRRQGNRWVETDRIQPADSAPQDKFGDELALDHGRALVSAPGGRLQASRIYAYVKRGRHWREEPQLDLPAAEDSFGPSTTVAMVGDLALVGAPYSHPDDARGAVFAYRRLGETWTPAQTLVSSDPDVFNARAFGTALAFDGDTALVGVPTTNQSTGAAFLYGRGTDIATMLRITISWLEGQELPSGTERSLVAKLEAAIAALDPNRPHTACRALQALVRHASAQRGRQIPSGLAEEIIEVGTGLREFLGCP